VGLSTVGWPGVRDGPSLMKTCIETLFAQNFGYLLESKITYRKIILRKRYCEDFFIFFFCIPIFFISLPLD
jgi:hypothetical protein